MTSTEVAVVLDSQRQDKAEEQQGLNYINKDVEEEEEEEIND